MFHKVTFGLQRSSGGPLRLAVEAADNIGLRATVYYDHHSDSVAGGRQLRGKEAKFQEPIPLNLVRNGELDLELFVADEGGNITRVKEILRPGG